MEKGVAIYLRLSVEEKNISESESISNQRIYLKEYINKHDELKNRPIIEFKDDGYSGTNTNRPGFTALIEEAKRGGIDTIVVKDLSRFSRDYLLVGDYLENVLPFLQTRLIAINDNFDSNTQTNGLDVDIQFKTLLYDFYSKDCSSKVKSVQNSQKRQGKYLGWNPPFGYKKDPNDRHQLVIDEEVAPIVQMIYQLYLEGMSCKKIAQELTAKEIKTPSKRKEELTNITYPNRLGVKSKANKHTTWSQTTVSRILNNEYYIGVYVFNKTGNKVVGASHSQAKDKSEWERINDHHEAIIDQQVYEQVQQMKQRKTRSYLKNNKSKTKIEESPIKGVARCHECQHLLTMRSTITKTGMSYHYFWCQKCQIRSQSHVTLRVDKYEQQVYQCLVEQIGKEQLQQELEQQKLLKEAAKNDIDYDAELEKLKSKEEQLKIRKRERFEDYKAKRISREKFIELKTEIEQQAERIDTLKIEYEKQVKKQQEQQKINEKKEVPTTLTKEIVRQYIENMFIGKDGKMEIKFKKNNIVL